MVAALNIAILVATLGAGVWIGWLRGRDEMRTAASFLRGLGLCIVVVMATNFVILLAMVGLIRASLGAPFSLYETLTMLVLTGALWLPATGIAFTVQALRGRAA